MTTPVLSRLYTYPIKSARGVELLESRVGERGLELDRRFMVVDRGGHLLTARRHPRLLTVAVALEPGGLVATAPGRSALRVPLEPEGDERRVRVWDDWMTALETGREASAWFSDLLGGEFELVYLPDRAQRRMNPRYGTALVSFADGNPLHLVSEASLADLERRLGAALEVERFRPNLVVRGAEPYAEDGWRHLLVGGLALEAVEACARCVMLNLDPRTGRAGAEPLRTLSRYRREGKSVPFGMNLVVPAEGVLRVGDRLEVLGEARPSRPDPQALTPPLVSPST